MQSHRSNHECDSVRNELTEQCRRTGGNPAHPYHYRQRYRTAAKSDNISLNQVLARHKSTQSRLIIGHSPSPGLFEILAHRTCAPSVLGIASVQNVKHSFLFLAVCELFSCNDNGHSSVTKQYYVSNLDSSTNIDLRWNSLEVGWRIRVAQTDPTQNADIVHDLLVGSLERRSA